VGWIFFHSLVTRVLEPFRFRIARLLRTITWSHQVSYYVASIVVAAFATFLLYLSALLIAQAVRSRRRGRFVLGEFGVFVTILVFGFGLLMSLRKTQTTQLVVGITFATAAALLINWRIENGRRQQMIPLC